MMLNKVETFKSFTLEELEEAINAFCLNYRLEPLSVSITFAYGIFNAAVVVREY